MGSFHPSGTFRWKLTENPAIEFWVCIVILRLCPQIVDSDDKHKSFSQTTHLKRAFSAPRICTVEAGYLARLVRLPAWEIRRAPTCKNIHNKYFDWFTSHLLGLWLKQMISLKSKTHLIDLQHTEHSVKIYVSLNLICCCYIEYSFLHVFSCNFGFDWI